MVTPQESHDAVGETDAFKRQDQKPARVIALGCAALIAGFNLIGTETIPDASPEDLDALIVGLLQRRESALLFVEVSLARKGGQPLQQVRAKGGRIVVVEIPSLDAPQGYESPVEDLVRRILGRQALAPLP